MEKKVKVIENTKSRPTDTVDLTAVKSILEMETALHSISLELAVGMRNRVQAEVNRVGYGEATNWEEITMILTDEVEKEEITIVLKIGDFSTRYIYPYQFNEDDSTSDFQEEATGFFED